MIARIQILKQEETIDVFLDGAIIYDNRPTKSSIEAEPKLEYKSRQKDTTVILYMILGLTIACLTAVLVYPCFRKKTFRKKKLRKNIGKKLDTRNNQYTL